MVFKECISRNRAVDEAARKRGGIIMAEKMEKAKKREIIESMAEKFVLLQESDKAYIAGYMAGIQEERAKWEKQQQVATA